MDFNDLFSIAALFILLWMWLCATITLPDEVYLTMLLFSTFFMMLDGKTVLMGRAEQAYLQLSLVDATRHSFL